MKSIYAFPAYLFSESWAKSNGFAGFLRLHNGNSEFSLLVEDFQQLTEVTSYLVSSASQDDQWARRVLLA